MTESDTSARGRNESKGKPVSKDKKKKKDKKEKSGPAKAVKGLIALAENPLVGDVVAAALVGMAAALKDSDKARKMAGKAGEQLDKMSKTSAKKGNAMWDLALDIGRQTLETLAKEAKSGKGSKSK